MCSDAVSNFLSHAHTQTSLRPLLITSHLQAWKLSLLEDLTQTEAVNQTQVLAVVTIKPILQRQVLVRLVYSASRHLGRRQPHV